MSFVPLWFVIIESNSRFNPEPYNLVRLLILILKINTIKIVSEKDDVSSDSDIYVVFSV